MRDDAAKMVNISAYRFVGIPKDELSPLRKDLDAEAKALALKGTILLSTEGINLFLAAPEADIKAFWEKLTARAWFSGMAYQESKSEHQPFKKMLVKIRREIITFDRPEVDPLKDTAPRITPLELKKWLDEGRDFVLLDTRNAFEVEFGTFETATHLDIRSFRQFPAEVENRAEQWGDKPVVTFCTGGIRCEKAAPFMLKKGYREVYQLDGGILNYFAETQGAHWDGECFVFDERVGIDGGLAETGAILCKACSRPLTHAEQLQEEPEGFRQYCASCLPKIKEKALLPQHG